MKEAIGCEEKKRCGIQTISPFSIDIDNIKRVLNKESVGLWFIKKRVLNVYSNKAINSYFYEFNFEDEVDALYFKMMFD